MKKLYFILFFVVLFVISCSVVYASNENWIDAGNYMEPSYEGNCYYITTPQELAWVSYKSAVSGTTFSGKTIKLLSDIDISDYAWTPIGGFNATTEKSDDGRWFKGTFDGNGYSIKGLNVGSESEYYTEDYYGLFGYISGTIENLNLIDINLYLDSKYSGGLVGFMEMGGIVRNCSVSGVIHSEGGDRIGGIAGSNYVNSSIENSWCSVNYDGHSWSDFGGLVGYQRGMLNNCFYIGNAKNGYAIAGYRQEGATSKCYWASDICNTDTAYGSGSDYSISVTSEYMNSSEFLNILNDNLLDTWANWKTDSESGFPILDKVLNPDYFWIGDVEEPSVVDDVYEIYSPQHLAWIASVTKQQSLEGYDSTSGFKDKTFKLMNDINLSSKAWTPISYFQGVFDGNGHVIKGLKSPLFYGVGKCLVIDLGLENVNITTGDSYVGSLWCHGDGSIERCYATGQINLVNSDGISYVGGLVGSLSSNNCVVKNCYSLINVLAPSVENVGVFAGQSYGSITNSYSYGNVSGLHGSGFSCHSISSVNSCYWCTDCDVERDGLPYTDSDAGAYYGNRAEGLSKSDMCDSSSYVDWDFDDIWGINSSINDGLPYLLWQKDITSATTEVILNKSEMYLYRGESEYLTYSFIPISSSEVVSYSSSNSAIATVNSNGKVVAISGGTATIRIVTSSGLSDECQVIVSDSARPISISFDNISIYTTDGILLDEIPTNTSFYVVTDYTVYSKPSAGYYIMFVTYDKDGKFISMNSNLSFNSIGTHDVSCLIKNSGDISKIKVLLWDGLNTLKPLCPYAIYPN